MTTMMMTIWRLWWRRRWWWRMTVMMTTTIMMTPIIITLTMMMINYDNADMDDDTHDDEDVDRAVVESMRASYMRHIWYPGWPLYVRMVWCAGARTCRRLSTAGNIGFSRLCVHTTRRIYIIWLLVYMYICAWLVDMYSSSVLINPRRTWRWRAKYAWPELN